MDNKIQEGCLRSLLGGSGKRNLQLTPLSWLKFKMFDEHCWIVISEPCNICLTIGTRTTHCMDSICYFELVLSIFPCLESFYLENGRYGTCSHELPGLSPNQLHVNGT